MGDDILAELSDSAFDLPALEFEEDDVDLDEALVPALVKKKRDILIEVDEYFKKVITLNNEQQDLKTLFREAVFNDPVWRNFSDESFKFQIFSNKFSTWVDLDYGDVPQLNDGTHLKAVFLGDDKSVRHSKHKRKSRRKDSSLHRHKKERKLHSKRHRSHRVSSNDEYEVCYSKRPRTSYSSDEGRSLVTTTVLDEPNNTPYKVHTRRCNVSDNYYAMQYNLCSVSSTTLTVSAKNYLVSSSNHVNSEAHDNTEQEVEEGEMKDEDNEMRDEDNGMGDEDNEMGDEDNEMEDEDNKIVPASQGEVYRLYLGLDKKNPISALYELCAKLQYEPPAFEVIEHGSVQDPHFLMQVTVQGKAYIPEAYARKKKEAKTLAAEYCLKHMHIDDDSW